MIHNDHNKRPIYYQYLEIDKLEKKYHLVSLDEEGVTFILPYSYQINYSESFNDYKNSGHVCFNKGNKKFFLDFIKKNYNNFKLDIEKNINYMSKTFTNYQNKEFIEIKKDNMDYIYMYFNEYEYKIYSSSKFTLNEYFDIYLLLFSAINGKVFKNLNLLCELIYFNEKAIELYYNDVDILVLDLKEQDVDYTINEEMIVIKDDIQFLDYKNVLLKVEDINCEKTFNVSIKDNICLYNGLFNLYSFGKYKEGLVKNYDEILSSEELKIDEKYNLIKRLLEQKQLEIKLEKDVIKENLLIMCYEFIKANIDYEKWLQYHMIEFVSYDDSLNDKKVYDFFIENIKSYDEFLKIINIDALLKSICGIYLIVCPEHYEIKFNGLNNFICEKEVVLNENFSITY